MSRPSWLGVSLKSYLGPGATASWCTAVRDFLSTDSAVSHGSVELTVLPSFVTLLPTLETFRETRVQVGAQDVAWAERGAWTGEVPAADLAEIGCTHVEVGHAERRRHFGEDDSVVAAKLRAATDHALTPIVCVGEEEAGGPPARAADVVVGQVRRALGPLADSGLSLVVAYEPVWAIGQAESAPPTYISEVLNLARASLADLSELTLVYGGSAGPGLLTELGEAVDGLFLGRFAHDPAALAEVVAEAAVQASS